jgi:hypothetical protein
LGDALQTSNILAGQEVISSQPPLPHDHLRE